MIVMDATGFCLITQKIRDSNEDTVVKNWGTSADFNFRPPDIFQHS